MLSTYPRPVVARAIDPISGIPAMVQFLNLAKIRMLLDGWYDEHFADVQRKDRASRPRLPEPQRNPESDKRICDGLSKLSDYLSRSGDVA